MKQDYENCTTYTYDAQGSLLSEQSTDLCKKYLYNDFHQCICTEVIRGREEEAERILQENRYDGEGLRFSLIKNGKRTDFITNGWDNLAELDENGQVTKRIIRGMGIVASEDVADNVIDASAAFTGTAYHYYHGNERMDVEFIIDEAGQVVNGYTYDAFGTIVTSSEKLQNRYTYNGEAFDKTTEQYYLRKRFYNPKLSRFIQEDEYRGDGLNLYAFCANNPVMYVDPSGYKAKKCGIGGNETEIQKLIPDEILGPNGKMISKEYDQLVYGGYYGRKEYNRMRYGAEAAPYDKHIKATSIEKAIEMSYSEAQYLPGINNKALEYKSMFEGIPIKQNKNTIYFIYDTGMIIGYDRGVPTTWIRGELSSGNYHGHPMGKDRVDKYLNKK